MPNKEKCLESIHVHVGETLKRDLQDLALLENRAVGELIRCILEDRLYGAIARIRDSNPNNEAR